MVRNVTKQPETGPASAMRQKFDQDRQFFFRLALVLLVLTFLGFSTTYFIPVGLGRFSGETIFHVHGMLFIAWPVVWLLQTHTAAASRRVHRGVGLASIALATAMVITGLAVIGASIETWQARGVGRL